MNATAVSNIRPAASVLVLRDGPRGMEVLLMRRPERDNDFRSGACVFPGGVLDRRDADAHALCVGLDDARASARLGLAEGGLDYFVAALRECFEEVGLLFACLADGAPIDVAAHATDLQPWRHRLHHGEASLAQLLQHFGWALDLREMAYFAHWLTPVTRPKRFDTRFFVRLAPPKQQAVPDLNEALELMWLTPDEALDTQRGLKLLNVTQQVLRSLRGFADARSVFDHALAYRGVKRILPRPAVGRDGPRFITDDDPAYEEVARLDPDSRGEARCELAPGDVVQLSPRLWRVCGSGSHVYVVAQPTGGAAVLIGLAAPDAAQQAALQQHWPQAQPLAGGAVGDTLRVGEHCSLLVLGGEPDARAYVLVEEGIAIGAASANALAGFAIEWLAPAQGFMRRHASGSAASTDPKTAA